MVVAQFGGVFRIDVARNIVHVVTDVLERAALTFIDRDGRFGSGIAGVHVGHAFARVARKEVRQVAGDLEHVFHEVDLDAELVLEREFILLLVARPFGEPGVTVQHGGIGPRAVGIGNQADGLAGVFDHARHELVAVVEHRLVVVHDREVHVVVQTQPRADAHAAFGPHVILLVAFVADAVDAVLIVKAARNVIIGVFAAARNAQVVLVRIVHVLVEGFGPVGIAEIFVFAVVVDAHAFERGIRTAAGEFPVPRIGIGHDVVDRRIKLLRTVVVAVPCVDITRRPLVTVGHEVGLDGARVDREAAAVGDVHLAFGSRLGSHENHAESAAGAVNGGRRCVLEHRYAGDVLRIDRFEVALDAVDQHQRSAARTDRAGTADVDGRRARRLAVAHRDIEVGDRALQRTRDARIGAFGELPAVHLIHGTDQVAALDRTVTHDDDLFEDLLVLAQRHVERTPGADLLFEGLESQVHEDQHSAASGNGERVAAVGIGGGARKGIFHQHAHAGQRFALLVGHTAGDGLLPLLRGAARGRRIGLRRRGQSNHLVLDLIGNAGAGEYRSQHLVERRAVQRDVHMGKGTFAERSFIGKDHARLLGESRHHLAQGSVVQRQFQIVALRGESGVGIGRRERRERQAGA